MLAILAAAGLTGLATALVPTTWNGRAFDCKCYPGDECWPKSEEWSTLNTTLNGNLAIHVPPGAFCHNTLQGPLGNITTYNEAACSNARANFNSAQWTIDQPGAALWTYYTNETCRPTTDRNAPCTLGYYGVYVISAKRYDHVKAGVDFARTHDLRLVIRNTGHDFLGRSTGWGALIINTHSFKNATFTKSYEGPGDYHGSAVTVGAGIQGLELLKLGSAQSPPVTVVVGECATVGTAGGFMQGGGHGPVTTVKGMAADTVLELEVVTAAGDIVTANANTNPDLFWALRGGGPSAFGVVLSATFQTFTDVPSAGASLDINRSHTSNQTLMWEAITIFHGYANHFVDNGLYVYFEASANGLHVRPFVAIGQTTEQLDNIIAPVLRDLNAIGLRFSTSTRQYDTFLALYNDLFEPEGAGISALTGGWVFAHRDISQNNTNIINSFKNMQNKGASIIGHMWNPGYAMSNANNALNPRFRDASVHVIAAMSISGTAPWEQKMAAERTLTFDVNQKMKEAGPAGFGYVNEGDSNSPTWRDDFYGTSYPRLLDIRKKWDPNGVFYAIATPGTEDWEVIDYGTKLCKSA
ncbi:hypothetical protein KVR01_009147 [Diaporthe batatas]|uniref:uncharacterized protein n=1 Tax=Diaporthe batatas TaxID=748121 RepID=UPI001D051A59|nr:uncharacterized protein KVR01_009147 [Diaporthe batatas]KAG8160883.1 hypothetical protein KVR01_009147 [Diaporthe batatas]